MLYIHSSWRQNEPWYLIFCILQYYTQSLCMLIFPSSRIYNDTTVHSTEALHGNVLKNDSHFTKIWSPQIWKDPAAGRAHEQYHQTNSKIRLRWRRRRGRRGRNELTPSAARGYSTSMHRKYSHEYLLYNVHIGWLVGVGPAGKRCSKWRIAYFNVLY